MGGVLKSAMGLVKVASGNTVKANNYARATKTSPADCVRFPSLLSVSLCTHFVCSQISWSGCKDSQTSADATEAGKATGAMSYAFITALSELYSGSLSLFIAHLGFVGENRQQSYQQLLNNIRDILRSKYSQKPQLSSSHPMVRAIQRSRNIQGR
jgi:hypothetical protein